MEHERCSREFSQEPRVEGDDDGPQLRLLRLVSAARRNGILKIPRLRRLPKVTLIMESIDAVEDLYTHPLFAFASSHSDLTFTADSSLTIRQGWLYI